MKSKVFQKIKKELPEIKKNVSLKDYTTFKIGGPAKYFLTIKTKEDLVKAIKVAKKFRLPFFILGGGSNLLVSDKGFDGLVIKNNSNNVKLEKGDIIVADSGALASRVLYFALKNNLTGLEFLSGVPGTIGGAVVCNARAYFLGDFLDRPKSTSDVVIDLMALTPDQKIKTFTKEDFEFFPGASNIPTKKIVLISVRLQLRRGADIKKSQKYIKDYLNFRKNMPYSKYPTAGSIFQNYATNDCELLNNFKKYLTNQGVLRVLNQGVIPAGYLIDQCGLKGKRIGGAKISEMHANFIINASNASAKDVIKLIKVIKKAVKKKFGVDLKEEIDFVGFKKS